MDRQGIERSLEGQEHGRAGSHLDCHQLISGPLGIAHGFQGLSAPATATPTAVTTTPTPTAAAKAPPTVTASPTAATAVVPTAATAPAAWVVLIKVIA
jgi:hypothetical protein